MTDMEDDNIMEITNEINSDVLSNINEEYVCLLCKDILVDACYGPCGCRFCRRCIREYLLKEMKYCPGITFQCSTDVIVLDKDIQIDKELNYKISNLEIKKLEESRVVVESTEREKYNLRVNNNSLKCPYFTLGCQELLCNVNNQHGELVLENINHLKNEINVIEKKINNLIINMEIKSETISELRMKDIENTLEIEQLKVLLKETNDKLNQVELSGETKQVALLPDIKTIYKIISQSEMNYGIFIWKIDNFQQKRQMAQNGYTEIIFSNSFYSHKNGYKMRMFVFPDGNGNGKGLDLSINLQLLPGEFDSILSWPMEREVTIAILSQKTGEIHRFIKFGCQSMSLQDVDLFDKPKFGRNDAIGSDDFIKFEEMLNNEHLCKDNQIFLKCSVA